GLRADRAEAQRRMERGGARRPGGRFPRPPPAALFLCEPRRGGRDRVAARVRHRPPGGSGQDRTGQQAERCRTAPPRAARRRPARGRGLAARCDRRPWRDRRPGDQRGGLQDRADRRRLDLPPAVRRPSDRPEGPLSTADKIAPIELEIIYNALVAAAAEMDVTVWRTSRSTIVRELL